MSEPAATYDPALVSDLDRMRDALDDINVAAPFAPDVTYLAYLADAGGTWRLAAAAMARKFASRAINSPTSFNLPGDLAVNWGDRAAAWLRIAASLEAEASRLDTTTGAGLWSATVERADLISDAAEYSIDLRRR